MIPNHIDLSSDSGGDGAVKIGFGGYSPHKSGIHMYRGAYPESA